jgi:iron complex outermembrane receptor protein
LPLSLAPFAAWLAVTAQASEACAQDAAPLFHIRSEPLAAALVDFAVQARMSVSTDGVSQCARSAPLDGRVRPAEALERLLAGTGCSFQLIDPRTVIVFRARPRPPPPVRRASEPAEAPPAASLEPLLVTAGRRTVLLDRAPYSASVVTGADLDAAGASDIGDVAPLVAGLSMTDLGPGRDKLFLRGLSDGPLTGETQSTVGVYLDGARLTYNAPDPDLRLVDVARVEILRGPQGALYGAGSIGGLVQIETRRPDLQAWSAAVDASASATQGGAPGWAADGVLNLPIVRDKLGLRIASYDERDGGYIDDVRLGLRNANSVARKGVRAAALWDISSDWSASLSVAWQSLNSADTHYAQPSVGPLARDVLLREPHDNDLLAVALSVEGREPWGHLSFTSSVVSHQFDSRYDASLALPQFVPGAAVVPSPFDEANATQSVVNELTAASRDTGRLRWLAGVFVSASDDDLSSTLTAPIGAGGAPVAAYRQSRSDTIGELAVYGQLTYQIDPRLALSVGGRWFGSQVSTQATTTQAPSGAASAFSGKTSNSGFAPQATLRFLASDDVTLYGQVSEGYRAGGFNTAGLVGQAFAASTAGPEPERRFSGDELWNYEAGAKLSLFGGAARIRAAGFYMVWYRVQSDQLLPDGLPYTANLGDGRDFGGEVEADIRPGAHWRLQANATLNEPDLTHPNPAFAAAPDNGLPGVPTFSGGASASYERPLGEGLSLRLQGSYAYVGASRLTLDATTSAAMGNYGFGRLSAELEARSWTFGLDLRAPLTGLGDTFAYGNPFTFRDFPQTTPQRPATVTFRIARRLP